MDKETIRTRCRKVFLTPQNNAIFWPRPFGTREETTVFISEWKAEANTREQHARAVETTLTRLDRAAGKPTGINYKTVAFYLVPASRIDD